MPHPAAAAAANGSSAGSLPEVSGRSQPALGPHADLNLINHAIAVCCGALTLQQVSAVAGLGGDLATAPCCATGPGLRLQMAACVRACMRGCSWVHVQASAGGRACANVCLYVRARTHVVYQCAYKVCACICRPSDEQVER